MTSTRANKIWRLADVQLLGRSSCFDLALEIDVRMQGQAFSKRINSGLDQAAIKRQRLDALANSAAGSHAYWDGSQRSAHSYPHQPSVNLSNATQAGQNVNQPPAPQGDRGAYWANQTPANAYWGPQQVNTMWNPQYPPAAGYGVPSVATPSHLILPHSPTRPTGKVYSAMRPQMHAPMPPAWGGQQVMQPWMPSPEEYAMPPMHPPYGGPAWHTQQNLSHTWSQQPMQPGVAAPPNAIVGRRTTLQTRTKMRSRVGEINRDIVAAQHWQQILDIAIAHSHIYDSVNTSTSLHRIAQKRPSEDEMEAILNHPGFKKLTILASTQLQSCRAQQLANIIWAFATLDFLPIPQFLEGLAEEAITKRSGFNPQNVANMLWAYAKLDYEPRCPLLTTLAEEAAAKLHDFNSQNVSNMLWAFAKFVFIPSRQLLDAAVNKISSTLNQFNPQAIKDALWAFATINYLPSTTFLDKCAAHCLRQLPDFNPQNIANVAWAYAKFGHEPTELFKALAKDVVRRHEEFQAQNISNTIWAFASLGYMPSEEFLDVVERHLMEYIDPDMQKYSAQGLENVLWSFATLNHQPSYKLLVKTSEYMLRNLVKYNQQNLALTLWAYAKLGFEVPASALKAASSHAAATLAESNPQNLANIMWAFATMDITPPKDLMDGAIARFMSLLSSYNPQGIANTMWSFASLGYFPGKPLMEMTVQTIARNIYDFSSQHIAVTMWAVAKLDYKPSKEIMQVTINRALELMPDYNPQNIANTLWSFATLAEYPGAELLDKAAQRSLQLMADFNQQALSNTLWSYAILRHHPGDAFLDAAAEQILHRIGDFNAQALAIALLAYATLAHKPPEAWLRACVEHAMSIVSDFDAQAVANAVWALGFMDYLPAQLWSALMEPFEAACNGLNGSANPENLRQIFQVKLLLECDGKWGDQYFIPASLLEKAEQAWKEQALNIVISKLHHDVSASLDALGLPHVDEFLTEDQLFSIDIAIQDQKLAIEVDGPFHFSANTQVELGGTRCRKKLLEARGWKVASIPYFTWADLETTTEQEAYLRKFLQEHDVVIPAGRQADNSANADSKSTA